MDLDIFVETKNSLVNSRLTEKSSRLAATLMQTVTIGLLEHRFEWGSVTVHFRCLLTAASQLQFLNKRFLNKNKKDANSLRLNIVLSHHMHRNWIEKSEAGRHKNCGKKILEKKFWKKSFEKKISVKNFGKINYKTKIFITKIYSNIDKCHTIFALLALFDKTGRKTGSN